MPGQIRQLDPNWASCEYSSYALFDPPIALKGVPNFLTSSSAAAEPTPTSVDPGVSATPGQSSNDDSPPATSKPQPQRPTSTRVPVEPQESDSSTPQNPSPSFPQDPLPSAPQDPPLSTPQAPPPSDPQAPPSSDPQDLPPNNPQNPWISPSNSDSPGSPLPSNTPGPLHHDPQDVVTGQHLATNPAANLAANPTLPVITIGPTVISVDPTGGVIVHPGTTLISGGAPITISSSTFSIGTGGLTIISPETSTEIPFGNDPITVPIGPSGAPVVLNPAASTIIFGGTTLTPGGAPITIDGTTLSMGSSGMVVVGPSDTSTITIPTTGATPTAVTVGSEAFPITRGSVVLAPGTTLGAGDPAVTISGTVFSVASTGFVVVANGQTSTVPVTLGASGSVGATRAGTDPSETGAEELPGAGVRIGWNKALFVGLAGIGYVMI
jgi:hypothetical protein